MNHKEIFTDIYDRNVWGGSGGGSSPEVTVQYRELLQNFLKEKGIESVVDFGCGDWQFSKLIDWSGVLYFGFDCVESVIQRNAKEYGSPDIIFHCSNEDTAIIPADLLILKDVLQHWTNKDVEAFLKRESGKFKYILITNNSNQTEDNQDSADPHIHTRALSARFEPLKQFDPVILLETNVNEPKETCLITRK